AVDRSALIIDVPVIIWGGTMDNKSLPMMGGEKNFLIVIAWLALGLHVKESVLPVVRAACQIGHRHAMGVIPARAGRRRREYDAPVPVGRNRRAAFFLCSVNT